jgi:hypothetical protein
MMARMRGSRIVPVIARVERPEAVGLAALTALLAGIGWVVSPFWLAVVVGLQLAIGGLGAVHVLGPVQPGLGFARYATFAMAAVAFTLFGRILPAGTSLLLVPVVAVALWGVLWAELRFAPRAGLSWLLDLLLVGILFAASSGIWQLLGERAWPPPLLLVLLLASVLALRAAEARGWSGIRAVGQAALHVVAVGQIAAALVLLGLPGMVAPAILALAFHAWGGAAEALDGGASWGSVAREFGSLAALALIAALAVAFLLHQPA